MSKPVYLNENDLVRRGDVITAFNNLKCIAARKDCPAEDLKCQFTGTILTVPPASENATTSAKFVLNHDTVQKKMELAEKILELDRKIARLDKSLVEIGDDDQNKTYSMVITGGCTMPFVDIDVRDIKSMLRKYRDNLRIKLDALWKEFATIELRKEAE